MTTVRVELDKVRLFGYHGIHPEEKIIGAEFEVRMQVTYTTVEDVCTIDQTIDYTVLYQITREEMTKPYPLLETLGTVIADRVKNEFPRVTEINITISKINPPVVNFRGELSVSINKKF